MKLSEWAKKQEIFLQDGMEVGNSLSVSKAPMI
jgi:hypothetical protein